MPPPRPGPSVTALAHAVGFLGPFAGAPSRDRWTSDPSIQETAGLDALRSAADWRVHQAHGAGAGSAHLRTALGWLRRFQSTFPSREFFIPHTVVGDVEATIYNEESLRLLGEFIRRHGSVRASSTSAPLLASTISDYLSALRAFRSREVGYNLVPAQGTLRLPKQLLQMRREDGPAGRRELSRALTARILVRLLNTSFDVSSRRGILRWAILWVGHNLLLRGGEFGAPDNRPFDATSCLTVADVEWIRPCAETDFFDAAVVDVMPLKDTHANRSRVPCLIRRRSQSPWTASRPTTTCAWEALRRLWECRAREASRADFPRVPLFAFEDGRPVRTLDVLGFIREAANAAGEPAAAFDARALRIAGATDLHHLFGPGEAERLIQKRGRWCSLIHDIYTRLSATSMLDVSARMADAEGVDLEAFRHGYVQPATISLPRAVRR